MIRRPDRIVIGIVAVLATGGWVCQSNVDNRCPGALTCSIDVSTVCCPFGSATWCGGCASGPTSCRGDKYTCSDDSIVLPCSFSATIDSLTCGDPVVEPEVVRWRLRASGHMEGCGQETAFVAVDDDTAATTSCGSWSPGVFGGCIPTEQDISQTTWSLDQALELPPSTMQVVEVAVMRAHGKDAVLASQQIICGP